jgi:hypothetical protein
MPSDITSYNSPPLTDADGATTGYFFYLADLNNANTGGLVDLISSQMYNNSGAQCTLRFSYWIQGTVKALILYICIAPHSKKIARSALQKMIIHKTINTPHTDTHAHIHTYTQVTYTSHDINTMPHQYTLNISHDTCKHTLTHTHTHIHTRINTTAGGEQREGERS